MKKLLTLVLCLSLALTGAYAQKKVAPAPKQKVVTDGPVITFTQTKHDFGNIKEGDIVKHTFTFKNSGTQALIVSDVKVTCGCTTPDFTRTPVAPNKTGFIVVQFNSTGKPGQNHKVITVVSNSVKDNGQTPLSFTANALPREAATSAVK